jgi:hypothetical protein
MSRRSNSFWGIPLDKNLPQPLKDTLVAVDRAPTKLNMFINHVARFRWDKPLKQELPKPEDPLPPHLHVLPQAQDTRAALIATGGLYDSRINNSKGTSPSTSRSTRSSKSKSPPRTRKPPKSYEQPCVEDYQFPGVTNPHELAILQASASNKDTMKKEHLRSRDAAQKFSRTRAEYKDVPDEKFYAMLQKKHFDEKNAQRIAEGRPMVYGTYDPENHMSPERRKALLKKIRERYD